MSRAAPPPTSPLSLQDFKPLQQLSGHELASTLPYGGPFLLSPDASMLDLCDCMAARLRALDGVLHRMATDRDADAAARAMAEAAQVLLQQSTALHTALQAGVLAFPHTQSRSPSAGAGSHAPQGV
jgi:hypothetical protein